MKPLPIMYSPALAHAAPAKKNRAAMLKEIESGELEEITFNAAVFNKDKPNRNGFLFKGDWSLFAESFQLVPFVKDHDESLDATFGEVTKSWLDADIFKHTIKLTTREAMTAFVEGKIRRFSIAWYYESVECSICENELFGPDCNHYPGSKYKNDVCQPIFINPTGRHTAAVTAPASDDTAILATLAAHKHEINGTSADDRALESASKPNVLKGVQRMKEDSTTQTGDDARLTDTAPEKSAEQIAAEEILGAQRSLEAQAAQQAQSEEILIGLCANLLTSALDTSRLPEPTQERIRKQYAGRQFKATELAATIEEARAEIAAITGPGTVRGQARTTQMYNSDDAIRAAAYDMFDAERDPGTEKLKVAKLSGLRELYLMLTGDQGFTGNVDQDLMFAGLATTTNFPAIVKDSLNKKLVKSWDELAMTDYGWWQKIATVEPFTTLNDVDWVITGTIASLPSIAEQEEYPVLPIGDNVETDSWTKYGGYIPLTLEAILRDDLKAFKVFPRELALAGMRNVSEQVAAIFTANSAVGPTLEDTGALFNATAVTTAGGHKNLLTTALGTDYTAWSAVSVAMYSQPLHVANTYDGTSKLGLGKPQAVRPKYCLVPIELSDQADSLFLPRWEANINAVPSKGGVTYAGKVEPVVVPEWTDATDWAAVADPRIMPAVMIGQIFGVMPQIFIAGSERDPAMFMNDESRMKVRQFLVVGVSNYRPLHKSNVAG